MLAPLFHNAQTPIPLQVMVQYTCIEPMVFQVDPVYLPLDGIDFQFEEGITVNSYIVDVQGRGIATWNLSEGTNSIAIDLPSGMYYVNIVSQSQNNTIKWIVQ